MATTYGVKWPVYLIVAAILSFIALLVMRETRELPDNPDQVGDGVHANALPAPKLHSTRPPLA
jgi:hypothetical protein